MLTVAMAWSLGSPLMTVQSDIYCWLCGWHHGLTQWVQWGRIKDNVVSVVSSNLPDGSTSWLLPAGQATALCLAKFAR